MSVIIDRINNLRAQKQTLLANAQTETDPQKLVAMRDQIKDLNGQIKVQEDIRDEMSGGTSPAGDPEEEQKLSNILKSNEYARAFAYAIRNGVTPNKGRSDEKCGILYNALTISGGDPAGKDGGFLVPEDIDRTIRELRRAMMPLGDLFTYERVTAPTGWRVIDTAPTKGFTKLTGEIPSGGVPKDDQPAFAKKTYTLDTYGLRLPVSNELAADEVANLFGYIARWFARKQVLTENVLVKTAIELLTSSNIPVDSATKTLNALKTLLNKTLDPAISATATILTNQDGYDYLDGLVDSNGRPLLQPDPTNATATIFKGRQVKVAPNSILPTKTITTTGATKGDYYPVYAGDFSPLRLALRPAAA